MPKMGETAKTSGQRARQPQAEAGLQKQRLQNQQQQQEQQSQGRKVKFCMYHLQGVCKFTKEECLFAHSTEEMHRGKGGRRKKPDPVKADPPLLHAEAPTNLAWDGGAPGDADATEGDREMSRGLPYYFHHQGRAGAGPPAAWPALAEPMFVAPPGQAQTTTAKNAKNTLPEGAPKARPPQSPAAVAAAAAAATGRAWSVGLEGAPYGLDPLSAQSVGLVPALAAAAGYMPSGPPVHQGLLRAGVPMPGALGMPAWPLSQEQAAFAQAGLPASAAMCTHQDLQDVYRTIESISQAINRLAVQQGEQPEGREAAPAAAGGEPLDAPMRIASPVSLVPPAPYATPKASKVELSPPPGLTL